MTNRLSVGWVAAWGLAIGLTGTAATGQNYTFTSGPGGDGFNWPASPTGLLDGDDFFTPDGVDIFNDTGNSVFFDQQYQVVGNGSRITGDALWGNPADMGFTPTIYFDFNGFSGIQELGFDFAWSQAGVPAVSDFVEFVVEDSDGRFTFGGWSLGDTFTGFGGGTGYEDRISLDASMFTGEDNGEDFVDIASITIFLDEIATGGSSSEFAIDNLALDGSGGGPGGGGPDEVFPSVNQGQSDVTGNILGGSTLRGTGTFGRGIEVTNGTSSSTTYSTELVPGGDLTSGTHPNGDNINAGQSIFTPDVASIDRSLPSGIYDSDIRIINDGDPTDPDNISTLRARIVDPESLSGNFANVDVLAADQITLSNSTAVASGFRASVEVTGSQTTGPFEVNDFAIDTAVSPGETAQTTATFNRFGQLSGNRTGTHTVSLQQTFFLGINNAFEVFLANTEAVPDQVWSLSFNLADHSTDSQSVVGGSALAQAVGVNNANVAATFIDGNAFNGQNITMSIVADPAAGGDAALAGDAVSLAFSGIISPHVLQLTYDDANAPGGDESALELLFYDTNASSWDTAVNANVAGSPAFFAGSYEDFLAQAASSIVGTNLGAYGLDTANNHVWAILDFEATFAVGSLAASALLGDYNGDGFVSQGDLDLVLLNWGDATLPAGFDTNALQGGGPFDNLISQNELDGVLLNWGNGTPPVTAVPEPTSLALLSLAGLATLARRRKA